MKRILKLSAGIGACLLAVVVALIAARSLYPSIAAKYPESWLKVRPGMTSDEARKFLGQPYADGRDLKILDRWQETRNGVEMHLDLWFKNENNGYTPITEIDRWKHFLGKDTEASQEPLSPPEN